MKAELEEVRANLAKRDHIDSSRADSPLKQAEDAILLDNSALTLEEQMLWFNELFQQRTSGKNGED